MVDKKQTAAKPKKVVSEPSSESPSPAPSKKVAPVKPTPAEAPATSKTKAKAKAEAEPEVEAPSTSKTKAQAKAEPESEVDPEADEEEEAAGTTRKAHVRPTAASHLAKYDELIGYLDQTIDESKKRGGKGVRVLQHTRMLVKKLHSEFPKLAKKERRQRQGPNGFTTKAAISDELADFIKVPHGTALSYQEVADALCAYVNIKEGETRQTSLRWEHLNPKRRSLQDPANKMRIIPDKKLATLLRYDDYVARVNKGKILQKVKNKATGEIETRPLTDTGLKYCTVRQLIKVHFSKIGE